jgi:high affinity sulfate transporter 1
MDNKQNSDTPSPVSDNPGRLLPSASQTASHGVWKWLPGLNVLRHYQLRWLRKDLFAGLVLTAILIPVGMGYAQAAGLPPIYGLYATIVPLLAYAVFGPSRILVLGPDSSLAAMIAAIILPLGAGDPARTVALAGMLGIFTGVLCILAGLVRVGFITELLSKPIRYGYMNGIALTILIGQLPKLFGFSAGGDGVIASMAAFIQGLLAGSANWVSLALGSATLIFILAFKRFKHFPSMLIAIVGVTLVTGYFNLVNKAGVTVVGVLPQGLPSFTIPWIQIKDIAPLLVGAITIAIVSFAETSVLSRSYAAKVGSQVNTNQELIGLGAANIATGFFLGFPISSSASRTPVAESAGSKTQVTGITGAVVIALLLVFAPGLLKNLPNSALAAVVITAAISLFEIKDLHRLYHIQKWEFWLMVACFLGVAIFGPIPGILFSIIIALLEFVWDGWRPHSAVLGRVDGIKGYHDITRYPDARLIPGLLLFRWDAPLFFPNAELFHNQVREAIQASPTPVRWFMVASEPITSVDVTAADMLAELDDELSQAGIQLNFAEMKDPVKDKLKRFGLLTRFDETHFYVTLGKAVNAYLKSSGVEWEDWEEASRGSDI